MQHILGLSWVVLLASFLAVGCGDDDGGADTGAADTGSDGAQPDTGGFDSGSDANTPDAAGDSAVDDAAVADSGGDASPDARLGTAMSFFVSSAALTGHGNLGGLAAADAHCVALASAAAAVRTNWVAYLSTSTVNAVDRIGSGPWFNADGEILATDLAMLHPTLDPAVDRPGYIAVKPADALFMDENGATIAERSHDIFTGSNADGTVFTGRTCQDWTSNARADIAQVGHTDTPANEEFSPSWNSAHDTQNCSASGVSSRGGVGLIYCFATD